MISFIISQYELNENKLENNKEFQEAFMKANAHLGKKPQQHLAHQVAESANPNYQHTDLNTTSSFK